MTAIAQIDNEAQVATVSFSLGAKASAYGGVLLLAKAWAVLGGNDRLTKGLRWQGLGNALLLFAVVALPVLSPSSILGVANLCAKMKDPLWAVLAWAGLITQRRLTRFVSSARHDWLQVLGAMVEALVNQEASKVGEEGAIAVDSFTVEKRYGPHLPGIRPVYDACKKRLVDGYEVVSACVVGGKGAWPVGLLPHRKPENAEERGKLKRRRRKAKVGEWPSKLDLALQLVILAVGAGAGMPTVVGDSAFAVMWWLQEIEALQLQWLVSTRQDRRLRIGAEIRQFRQWVKDLPLQLVESSEAGTTVWGGLLPEATLLERHRQRKGLACQPAYFERRNRQGKVVHRWYEVTSCLEWDLATIWQYWGWRWSIEVLHRESKQHGGLADFHGRNWEGVVAGIVCSSLRMSLLYFLQAWEPTCRSLSIEALVIALREAACVVTKPVDGPRQISLPTTLPAMTLWQEQHTPFPDQYWPVVLQVA